MKVFVPEFLQNLNLESIWRCLYQNFYKMEIMLNLYWINDSGYGYVENIFAEAFQLLSVTMGIFEKYLKSVNPKSKESSSYFCAVKKVKGFIRVFIKPFLIGKIQTRRYVFLMVVSKILMVVCKTVFHVPDYHYFLFRELS